MIIRRPSHRRHQTLDGGAISFSGFGTPVQVSIDNSTAIVGSIDPGVTSYPVRIYEFDGNSWFFTGSITRSSASIHWGSAVDVKGNLMVAADPGFSSARGYLRFYKHNGSSWVDDFELTGSVNSYSRLGQSCGVDGNKIVAYEGSSTNSSFKVYEDGWSLYDTRNTTS